MIQSDHYGLEIATSLSLLAMTVGSYNHQLAMIVGWSLSDPITIEQQSSARAAFRSSRPERLNCSCRRAYIPATVLLMSFSQGYL